MSAKQIDEALSLWQTRLNIAAQNLVDLQSHPIYERISAQEANVSGETAEQAGIAVRTLGYVLQCFELLHNAIDRAGELRRDMPALFGTEEREREIVDVLWGKSIHLPAVQVPFKQRSLLTSIENIDLISPSELLKFMESAFENVKQIVLRLETAWESLGSSISQAAQRLQRLEAKSETLTRADQLDIEKAAQRLKSVEQAAKQDPLGAGQQLLTGVDETLRKISAKLDQQEREQDTVRQALSTARNLLTTLKTAHEAVRTAYFEAREKTGYRADFDASDQKVQALITWFERLNGTGANSPAAARLIGLKNWSNAAEQALNAGRAVLSQAKHQLAVRSELRGRLDALKAKARAYSLAENDELIALADQATALLYRRPTPIDEAASIVSAYESKLNLQAKNLV